MFKSTFLFWFLTHDFSFLKVWRYCSILRERRRSQLALAWEEMKSVFFKAAKNDQNKRFHFRYEFQDLFWTGFVITCNFIMSVYILQCIFIIFKKKKKKTEALVFLKIHTYIKNSNFISGKPHGASFWMTALHSLVSNNAADFTLSPVL